jgi:peptidoglycan-N-acetylglucosamine deacetylase
MSYNEWLYAYDNSVNLTDPSGMDVGCNVYDESNPRCHPESKPTSSGKTAYITFDDGPSVNSIPIAIKLQEENMRATFFVVGTDNPKEWDTDKWRVNLGCDKNQLSEQDQDEWAGKPIVRLLYAMGHSIGIHAWYHNNYWDAPGANPSRDVGWMENVLKKSLGVTDLPQKLIRASGGQFGKIPYSGYENWYYYGWNVNSRDWAADMKSVPSNAPIIIESLRSELEKKNFPNNAIILLHEVKAGTTEAIVNQDLLGKLKTKEFGGYTNFLALPRSSDASGTLIGGVD